MIVQLGSLKLFLELSPRFITLLVLVFAFTFLLELIIKKLRERRYIHFANFATLKRIEGESRFYSPPFLLVLRFFLLATIVLILLGNVRIFRQELLSNVSLGFVVDRTVSSTYLVNGKSFLEAEKSAVKEILAAVGEDTRVFVVGYGPDADVIYDGKNDKEAVDAALSELKPSEKAGADLKSALKIVAERIPPGSVVFLFSFSGINTGGNLTDTALELATRNITIYASVFIPTVKESVSTIGDLKLFEVEGIKGVKGEIESLSKITGGKVIELNEKRPELTRILEVGGKEFQALGVDERAFLLKFLAVLLVVELLVSALYGAI